MLPIDECVNAAQTQPRAHELCSPLTALASCTVVLTSITARAERFSAASSVPTDCAAVRERHVPHIAPTTAHLQKHNHLALRVEHGVVILPRASRVDSLA